MQTAQFQLQADVEQQHWWFVARRRILQTLVRQVLPPNPSETIVDVGCGTGGNVAALAGDYRCIGIDPSADAIRLARHRFASVEFVRGLAPLALGRRMREARLVLMTDVLEHIADDFEIFSSLVAETLPGTFFVVTVPAELALWNRHDESHGHYRRYDRPRLAQVWDGLPIEPLLISHFNRRLYPLIKAVRLFNRWRGEDRVVGQHGTDLQLPARSINRLLEKTFAGEATTLCRALAGQSRGYSRGVSLVAIMRRTWGRCTVREKPGNISRDRYDPVAAQHLARAA